MVTGTQTKNIIHNKTLLLLIQFVPATDKSEPQEFRFFKSECWNFAFSKTSLKFLQTDSSTRF